MQDDGMSNLAVDLRCVWATKSEAGGHADFGSDRSLDHRGGQDAGDGGQCDHDEGQGWVGRLVVAGIHRFSPSGLCRNWDTVPSESKRET